MAAILGLIPPAGREKDANARDMEGMIRAAGRRFATWRAADGGVALAASDRQVLDLTPDGRQPATLPDAGLAAVLDGYIANAPALRRELEDAGVMARGHGDAEILCLGVAQWGLNRLLQKLEGGFSFALWDGQDGALHLVRDRMGARPVFVYAQDGLVAFTTDPAALKGVSGHRFRLDPRAVRAQLAYGYVPAPLTFDESVICLPPGHRLMLRPGETALPRPEAWWSPAAALEEITLRDTPRDPARLERLRAELAREAIRLDVGFSVLDDGPGEARLLQSVLERVHDKPLAVCRPASPDGIEIQRAFDALIAGFTPCADPGAVTLWHMLKQAAARSRVVLYATAGYAGEDEPQGRPKLAGLPPVLRRAAAAWLPAKYAVWATDGHSLYKARQDLWSQAQLHALQADPPSIPEPRLEMPASRHAAYLEMCGPLRDGWMPMTSMLARAHDVDLRTPWADHRALAWYLPRQPVSHAEVATWLRGPLRIRLQGLMDAGVYQKLGIVHAQPIEAAWKRLLAGDDTPARALWVYLVTAAWVNKDGGMS